MRNGIEITKFPDVLKLFAIACKNYGDGRSVIKMAQNMGLKNERSLNNKLNPYSEYANLSQDDVCSILQLSGDPAPLRAMGYLINYMVMPMPECKSNLKDVLNHFMEIFTACSNVGNEIKDATCEFSELDSDLSRKERKAIQGKLDELINDAICLRQSLAE